MTMLKVAALETHLVMLLLERGTNGPQRFVEQILMAMDNQTDWSLATQHVFGQVVQRQGVAIFLIQVSATPRRRQGLMIQRRGQQLTLRHHSPQQHLRQQVARTQPWACLPSCLLSTIWMNRLWLRASLRERFLVAGLLWYVCFLIVIVFGRRPLLLLLLLGRHEQPRVITLSSLVIGNASTHVSVALKK